MLVKLNLYIEKGCLGDIAYVDNIHNIVKSFLHVKHLVSYGN